MGLLMGGRVRRVSGVWGWGGDEIKRKLGGAWGGRVDGVITVLSIGYLQPVGTFCTAMVQESLASMEESL